MDYVRARLFGIPGRPLTLVRQEIDALLRNWRRQG